MAPYVPKLKSSPPSSAGSATTPTRLPTRKITPPPPVTTPNLEEDLFDDIIAEPVAAVQRVPEPEPAKPVELLKPRIKRPLPPSPPPTAEEPEPIAGILPTPIPTPTPAPAPAPVAPKKQGGLLSRLFQKPGGNRDTDIFNVLKNDDMAMEFRSITASILAQYAPTYLFPELNPEGILYNLRMSEVTPGEESQYLDTITAECGITKEQAAEAYAEVTSAILVKVVDNAVDVYEKYKTDKDAILQACDEVTHFLSNAGNLFGQLYNGITIEPVQYNGKAKKNVIEDLYYIYYKASAEYEFKKSIEMFTSSATMSEGNEGVQEGEESEGTVQEKAEAIVSEEDELMTVRAERTGLLQRALAIKEGKRTSLEQKVTKELMMNSGLGGGGGLGDLMGALSGKGGGPGGVDMKALEEMMAAQGGGGQGGGGMPPFPGGGAGNQKMSEEEMLQMTKQSVVEVNYIAIYTPLAS